MALTAIAPMQKNSKQVQLNYQVQHTYNYQLFKELDGNRVKNPLHLKRLKQSMGDHYLINPIIVNERYEVIDGQHRLQCCMDLEKPVYYIVVKGYGLKEVQILNANMKNWNLDDYLSGYCDLGMHDYITYREFKERYGFGHKECINMLTGMTHTSSYESKFQLGEFKITSLKKAIQFADKISSLQNLYTGYNRRTFINAMINMLQNKAFNFDDFVKKLKQQSTKLVDCTTIQQYKQLIEEIYNYRRQDKVNLRY